MRQDALTADIRAIHLASGGGANTSVTQVPASRLLVMAKLPPIH